MFFIFSRIILGEFAIDTVDEEAEMDQEPELVFEMSDDDSDNFITVDEPTEDKEEETIEVAESEKQFEDVPVTDHGDQKSNETIVKSPESKYWTEEELEAIGGKSTWLNGTLVDAMGPLFVIKLDESFTQLCPKLLIVNPFHIEGLKPACKSLQDEDAEILALMIRDLITYGLTKWELKVTYSYSKRLEQLTGHTVVTAEATPLCPGLNMNYCHTMQLEGVIGEPENVLNCWKEYARQFGLEIYSSPDDPLPSPEIREGVLLGNFIQTECLAISEPRNLTTFTIVHKDAYTEGKEWFLDTNDLERDINLHAGRFVIFRGTDEKLKRGFIEEISSDPAIANIRGIDDGRPYSVEAAEIYVYKC